MGSGGRNIATADLVSPGHRRGRISTLDKEQVPLVPSGSVFLRERPSRHYLKPI